MKHGFYYLFYGRILPHLWKGCRILTSNLDFSRISLLPASNFPCKHAICLNTKQITGKYPAAMTFCCLDNCILAPEEQIQPCVLFYLDDYCCPNTEGRACVNTGEKPLLTKSHLHTGCRAFSTLIMWI
jgi:hypothetical protein